MEIRLSRPCVEDPTRYIAECHLGKRLDMKKLCDILREIGANELKWLKMRFSDISSLKIHRSYPLFSGQKYPSFYQDGLLLPGCLSLMSAPWYQWLLQYFLIYHQAAISLLQETRSKELLPI